MSRRLFMIPPALLLGVCMVLLPACKKKKTEDTGSGGTTDPVGGGGGTPPAVTGSDHLLFVQFNAKAVRDSELFAEVKKGVAKAGAGAEWDKFESEAAADIGVKLTEIDSVTAAITDLPAKGDPKVIAIVTANKAFNKSAVLKKEKATTPDASGFYKVESDKWLHFPDDKTLVLVHPDLAQQYLNGYAKNRSGWPMTADLTRAASGHTLYASVNVLKVPKDKLGGQEAKEMGALLSAKTVTLTANLKGKELSVAVRGAFPDAGTAGKAKDTLQGLVGMAPGLMEQVAGPKGPPEAAAFQPAIKQLQQTIQGLKLDTSGPDVVLTGSYKADFDIGQMVAEAMKQWKEESGPKMIASNNLKQIGLALHSYNDAMGRLPIHGVGANMAPLRNATDKPLLSWRVAILPYIEQDNLYKQFKFDEAWDGPNNKKLIAQMPKIFAPVGQPGQPGYTHLQMVIGTGGMPFGAAIPAGIPDGTSNTIAVVEAAQAVIWTKPDDVVLPMKLNPGDLKKKFGGQFPGGFHAVLWDGSTRFIPDTITERTLGLALNPRDGMVMGPDWDTSAPPRPGPGGIPPKGPIPPLGKK